MATDAEARHAAYDECLDRIKGNPMFASPFDPKDWPDVRAAGFDPNMKVTYALAYFAKRGKLPGSSMVAYAFTSHFRNFQERMAALRERQRVERAVKFEEAMETAKAEDAADDAVLDRRIAKAVAAQPDTTGRDAAITATAAAITATLAAVLGELRRPKKTKHTVVRDEHGAMTGTITEEIDD